MHVLVKYNYSSFLYNRFIFVLSINIFLFCHFIYLGILTITAYFVCGVFVRTISASLLTDILNTSCVEMPVAYLCSKLAASNCTALLFISIKSETIYTATISSLLVYTLQEILN